MEVVDISAKTERVEDVFRKMLDRYFSVDCHEDKSGNMTCRLSVRNIRYPVRSRGVVVKIPKDGMDNHGYVEALTQKGVMDLIYPVIR